MSGPSCSPQVPGEFLRLAKTCGGTEAFPSKEISSLITCGTESMRVGTVTECWMPILGPVFPRVSLWGSQGDQVCGRAQAGDTGTQTSWDFLASLSLFHCL